MEPALTLGAIGGPPTIILPLLLRIVWVVGARVGGGESAKDYYASSLWKCSVRTGTMFVVAIKETVGLVYRHKIN